MIHLAIYLDDNIIQYWDLSAVMLYRNNSPQRSTKPSPHWVAVVVTMFGLMACESEVVDVQPVLASIQVYVFDVHCVVCHGSTSPIPDLDLREGYSLNNMLYIESVMEPPLNRIEAGDPDNSLLVKKLEGTAATSRMPFRLPPLPQYKIDAVRQWVAEMAPVPHPTLIYLQDQIFNASCATQGCHDASSARSGLDLSEGNALRNIVDVPSVQLPRLDLVAPGDPKNSYLVRKLEGRGVKGYSMMPIGFPSLPAQQTTVLREWIITLANPQPTTAWIQSNIFDLSCAYSGCHDTVSVAADLDLSTGRSLSNMRNVPSRQFTGLNIIHPGHADTSYLVRKLEDNNIHGLRMPYLESQLSVEKIEAIRTWIDQMEMQN